MLLESDLRSVFGQDLATLGRQRTQLMDEEQAAEPVDNPSRIAARLRAGYENRHQTLP
jgi:hypothetical protein